jgi:hypothetical protein
MFTVGLKLDLRPGVPMESVVNFKSRVALFVSRFFRQLTLPVNFCWIPGHQYLQPQASGPRTGKVFDAVVKGIDKLLRAFK